MLVDKATLVSQLVPPLNNQLAQELVGEFVSQEKRYIQRDWEPTQLDGGQFCEILARLIYHQDSGTLNFAKSVEDCLKYIEGDQNAHAIQPRHNALHIARVIKTIYKFRSQRGAVHISSTYKPNHLDSKFIVDSVRWCFAETLRLFWNSDRERVASAIRELLQFDVPAIGKFEDVLLIQRTDLKADEEALVLLHYAGEVGFSRKELGRYIAYPPQRVSDALRSLISPARRLAILLPSGQYRLTDLGSKYVRDKLADRLFL